MVVEIRHGNDNKRQEEYPRPIEKPEPQNVSPPHAAQKNKQTNKRTSGGGEDGR